MCSSTIYCVHYRGLNCRIIKNDSYGIVGLKYRYLIWSNVEMWYDIEGCLMENSEERGGCTYLKYNWLFFLYKINAI